MTQFRRTEIASAEDSSRILPDPPLVSCWVSFGGNVDDVKDSFDAALALLSRHSQIQLGQRSGIYRTTPMGMQAGGSFLNSICGLATQLTPQDLLRVLQSVENQLGRVRDVRWGPRTLDLDLLSYGNQIINEPDLAVPHPALTYRRFVLDPLLEVDPNWSHPEFSLSVSQLLARLQIRPLRCALLDVPVQQIEKLAMLLAPKFPDLQLVAESELDEAVLPIQLTSSPHVCKRAIVDLRRSPGDMLEQLTSAFTSIFDAPQRISDWV